MTTFEMPTVLVNPANMQRYIRDKGKSFLGSGSFGLCYRFREIARGREVAVKVSKKNTPKEHKKMRQEADINRLFRHENVIQMFDYFMDKGQMYIVLEYCSNNSLKELLNRRTTITESECRYYIRQIVAGVEHIHSQKYVHRDLKLENVFLNEQLRAKIGDFGMSAKIRNDLPRKSFCGTPNYMAPEIVEEEAYYFEVDIWSIGCMLYALLYGKPPFAPRPNEHGLRGTYDRIQRVQYDLPADTPPATRALISALLQRVPSNRPNADQVLKFEFFNQPTPKWLPQTALCVEPDLSAMDFYETIKLQRLQHKQPNVPVRRPLAAISNHQPNGRQPQKQAAEDRAGKKTENGGKRLVEQMQMAMGELRIETNNTVRVVPSSTRRKTTLSQRRCNFEDHARILAVQLNGLVAKLRTAHNLPVEEMYRSRMQSPSCAPPIWITRWIARSDEFFAYSLSDKSHGAGFSDGSFMQLDKDLQRMTYIDQQLTEWPFLVAEDGDVPEALKPRVHQMWDVVDQLHGLNVLGIDKGNRQTAEEVDFLTREPVVRVWDIQAELAAMWLSNGLLQVNWRQGEERLKLFVCPLMQCVSFLDANQRFTTIKFDTLLTYGCAMKFRNYIEKLPDIVARLRQKHVDNQTRNAAGKRCAETGCRGLKRNDCNDGVAQPNAVFPLEVGHRNSL